MISFALRPARHACRRVQARARCLRRLGSARDFSLELGDPGVLGPESRLVVSRTAVGVARHLLRAVLLGVFVSLRERLLA